MAVKILKKAELISEFYAEVSILKGKSHQGIITLKDYGTDGVVEFSDESEDTSVRFIVTEYLPHNLFDVCATLGPMGEEAGKLFLNSVISALHELHINGNSHGDLKLENIVLDS